MTCKNVYDRDFPLSNALACVGKGWAAIVTHLYNLCDTYGVVIYQIKEKFGGLRFYVGEAPIKVHTAIEQAEKQSLVTCESCGGAAKVNNNNGWFSTRCKECYDAENKTL